jgi:spermidine synthase
VSDDTDRGGVRTVELARARSSRGEVVLRERGDVDGTGVPVLELRVNGVFVMDSLETSSEQALATAALAHVDEPRAVVVAGLGLGYTARQVLMDQRVERLAVVEVEEALVGWMRDGTIPHGPAFLADERLVVVCADVRQAMAEAGRAKYDLVLLDVDNGPDFLVYDDNAAVYREPFLRTVAAALRPNGAVAIWSSAESPALREALTEVFGHATATPLDVRLQSRDEQYWLYLARR